tara:strand:+ start:2513 stop:2806 length:294 start_codon:yes stop_codon:yes gene_type:complete
MSLMRRTDMSESWRDKILEERGNLVRLQFEEPREECIPILEIDIQDEDLLVAHDGYTALVACKDVEVICHHEGDNLTVFICRGSEILEEVTIELYCL